MNLRIDGMRRPRATDPDQRPLVRPPPIRLGSLEIDVLRRTARLGAITCQLSGSALSLLFLLAANAGRVLSRQEIRDALWRPNEAPTSNSIDHQIVQLRRRFNDDASNPRIIDTLPGRGYRFVFKDA